MSFKVKAATALSLGLANLYRALSYRLGVKLGLNPVRRIRALKPSGALFSNPSHTVNLPTSGLWQEQADYFGMHAVKLSDEPPAWHVNPLNSVAVKNPNRPWWEIPDFDPAVGDIKVIWEASRFDWVLSFAQEAAIGDEAALAKLNLWLNDWLEHNPPYFGPNWKCGQEASIRVMHLAMAALLLGQAKKPLPVLLATIELHLKRIEPTLTYAMAQDNNHGTSEAAALYIGGSWLAKQGISAGDKWQKMGSKWLENRAARLIGEDGSFSQYSLNYHRVMLDTFSMVEVWRRHLDLKPFSQRCYQRAKAATHWLHALTNACNGDGPNLGANDGARLLPLTATDYRDCRPSVQLASVLFAGSKAYAETGVWNLPLLWFGIDLPDNTLAEPGSEVFDQGGFAVLRDADAKVLLRYPRFRFRPSQADALHLDLWLKGRNLLRDAGTYSYNTESRWLSYFPGTESHNTVQFDDRDQMPRLSRFLFGDWLKTRNFKPLAQSDNGQEITAGYCDGRGASHLRQVSLLSGKLSVRDAISGFNSKAVLRWRLEPGNWQINDHTLSNGAHQMTVEASMAIVRFELVEGWESRYYLDKTPLPVLEIEVNQAGTLTTEYLWNP